MKPVKGLHGKASHRPFDIAVYLVHCDYPKWSAPAMSTRTESANREESPRGLGAKPTTVTVILKQQRTVTVETVREGLPVDSVEKLAKQLQVTSASLQRHLKLSKQTYARRRRKGRLSVDESDRVVRYADLFRSAVELLGNAKAAAQWLSTPAPALQGETPMDHATTEFGARDVIRLIGRLEHGIPT